MHRELIDGSRAAGVQEPSACHCNDSAIGPPTSPALAVISSDGQLREGGTLSFEIWELGSAELTFCFPQITLEFQNTVLSKAIKC